MGLRPLLYCLVHCILRNLDIVLNKRVYDLEHIRKLNILSSLYFKKTNYVRREDGGPWNIG